MLIDFKRLTDWREYFGCTLQPRRLVVTNGCFDLLHPGHVVYLQEARKLGDALLVGLNSDKSVRELKGPQRPIISETGRSNMLLALSCVDFVCIFNSSRATDFLQAASPHVYVKGGDYSLDTLHPDERRVLDTCGAEIHFIHLLPGYSTTSILAKVK